MILEAWDVGLLGVLSFIFQFLFLGSVPGLPKLPRKQKTEAIKATVGKSWTMAKTMAAFEIDLPLQVGTMILQEKPQLRLKCGSWSFRDLAIAFKQMVLFLSPNLK